MTLPQMMHAMKKLWKSQITDLLELRYTNYLLVIFYLFASKFTGLLIKHDFLIKHNFSAIGSDHWLVVLTIEEIMRHLKFCGVCYTLNYSSFVIIIIMVWSQGGFFFVFTCCR